MKKTAILTLAALVSCGPAVEDINTRHPDLVPVEILSDPFEDALSYALNADLDFNQVEVYDAPRASMVEICHGDVPACASGLSEVIVHTDPSNCALMMHEFAHIALMQSEGSIHADHDHPIFEAGYGYMAELCKEFVE